MFPKANQSAVTRRKMNASQTSTVWCSGRYSTRADVSGTPHITKWFSGVIQIIEQWTVVLLLKNEFGGWNAI